MWKPNQEIFDAGSNKTTQQCPLGKLNQKSINGQKTGPNLLLSKVLSDEYIRIKKTRLRYFSL